MFTQSGRGTHQDLSMQVMLDEALGIHMQGRLGMAESHSESAASVQAPQHRTTSTR